MNINSLEQSPLGKTMQTVDHYAPELLFPVPRINNRQDIGIHATLPFKGLDLWNGYEFSWLNTQGKPLVAMAQFLFPCESSHIVESKSFKLYLNSFAQTKFTSFDAVKNTLTLDLSKASNIPVTVVLMPLDQTISTHGTLKGQCLDDLEIICSEYELNPDYLHTENTHVHETLYSHLIKSNCPITGQPDWGSVQVEYHGKKINHEGLLRYWISFRQHNEFHEHCVERMFTDILRKCQPEKLTVAAFYTRRGGLDINPIRSTAMFNFANGYRRLIRQ